MRGEGKVANVRGADLGVRIGNTFVQGNFCSSSSQNSPQTELSGYPFVLNEEDLQEFIHKLLSPGTAFNCWINVNNYELWILVL